MKKNLTCFLIIIAVIASCFISVGYYFHFGMIGPGLPDSINGWYFPEPTGYDNNGTRMFTGTGSEHFGMTGSISKSCSSLFPVISDNCLQSRYARFYPNNSRMDGEFVVISWEFNRTKDFDSAEQLLYQSLKNSGNVSNANLNLSQELRRVLLIPGNTIQYEFSSVPVTRYISERTSGFFIEYKQPLLKERQDYIIMYYGVLDTADVQTHESFLTTLMVQGGFPQDPGRISGLMET